MPAPSSTAVLYSSGPSKASAVKGSKTAICFAGFSRSLVSKSEKETYKRDIGVLGSSGSSSLRSQAEKRPSVKKSKNTQNPFFFMRPEQIDEPNKSSKKNIK